LSKKEKKPLVIVTGPAKKLRFGWWAAHIRLWRAGLRACYVTAANPTIPENVHGILIGGGDDIDPKHYGRSGTAGANYDSARDTLELAVIRQALKTDLPIFGICRGSQLINIALGGNLHQDIRPRRSQTPNRNSIFPIKDAAIKSGSRLYEFLNLDKVRINSLHSQAVDQVGENLRAVAHDADGFIQAVEGQKGRFLLGVQWHPEYLLLSRQHAKIFTEFADAARLAHSKKLSGLKESSDAKTLEQ
jgi:putative glutamine amidotransferase